MFHFEECNHETVPGSVLHGEMPTPYQASWIYIGKIWFSYNITGTFGRQEATT